MKILPEKLREANFRSYMLGKGCDDDITTLHGIQIFVVRSLSLAVGWRRHIGSRSEANLPINRGFDHHLGFLGVRRPIHTLYPDQSVQQALSRQATDGFNERDVIGFPDACFTPLK
jgi:hypothetical protein